MCNTYCSVNLGNILDNGYNQDKNGKWQNNNYYDSCKSIHPAWAGNNSFPEWCIKNTCNAKIIKIELIDGTVEGTVNLPGVDVYTSGNCRFKGNISLKTLYISGNVTIG